MRGADGLRTIRIVQRPAMLFPRIAHVYLRIIVHIFHIADQRTRIGEHAPVERIGYVESGPVVLLALPGIAGIEVFPDTLGACAVRVKQAGRNRESLTGRVSVEGVQLNEATEDLPVQEL